MKCNQQDCDQLAAYRFTWPGQDEAGICEGHVGTLRSICNAMGMYCQIIPLEDPPAALTALSAEEEAGDEARS